MLPLVSNFNIPALPSVLWGQKLKNLPIQLAASDMSFGGVRPVIYQVKEMSW